jgi:hypothetical protein
MGTKAEVGYRTIDANYFTDSRRREKLIQEVVNNPSVKRSTVATLVVLLSFSDEFAHGCWPSIKAIAHRAQVSTRTVIRHLAELERAGYLKVTRYQPKIETLPNGKRKFASRRCNRYVFRQGTKTAGSGDRVMRKSWSYLHDTVGSWNLRSSSWNHRPMWAGGGWFSDAFCSLNTESNTSQPKRASSPPSAPSRRQVIILDEGFDATDFVSDDAWGALQTSPPLPKPQVETQAWGFSRNRFSDARQALGKV